MFKHHVKLYAQFVHTNTVKWKITTHWGGFYLYCAATEIQSVLLAW